MQVKKLGFDLEVYTTKEELPTTEKHLLEMAVKARKNAYAPYSNFSVGAAILLENGKIVLGNNQENACYPSGLCAERVAIFSAGANYPNTTILSVAISASSNEEELMQPAGPCGNCRQSMAEYEQKQESPISVIMSGASGAVYKCKAVQDLLPLTFNSSFLSDS